MKKILSLVLALCLFAVPLLSWADSWVCPVCGSENEDNFCPNDGEPRPEEPTYDPDIHVSDYLAGMEDSFNVRDLIGAADWALKDGMDPQKAGEELYTLAEEHNLGDALLWFGENVTAYGSEEYNRFYDYFSGTGRFLDIGWDYSAYFIDGVNLYEDDIGCSDTMETILSADNAQYCYSPVCWGEYDFKDLLGTEYSRFKPSSPRAGFACIVIKESAESAPKTAWREGDTYEFISTLETLIGDAVYVLGEDAPVFTGNPNIASEFWVFEITYPYRGLYGSGSDPVTGYNCTATLTVINATTRASIASVTATNRLGNTIYEWDNWIAKADIPVLGENSSFSGFTEKVRKDIVNARAKASSTRKITARNATGVVNGVMAGLAENNRDAWQQAVYLAGARDAQLEGDTLTFRIRSYNPRLSELGKYAEAGDKTAWLMTGLENAAEYDLSVTVKIADGQITQQGLNTLKQAVTNAANTAKNAFANREFVTALTGYLFPSPIEGKLTDETQLLTPTDAFLVRMEELNLSDIGQDNAWASLFYAQKSQQLNTNGGPGALVLTCVGADPAALLTEAYTEVLDARAFVSLEERGDSAELSGALLLSLAKKAVTAQRSANYRYTVTVDIDMLRAGTLPEEYTEYMRSFDFYGTEEKLCETDAKLLDIAAVQSPKTGRLTGNNKGTEVNFKLSAGSDGTYIQMRDTETNEVAVSLFVEGGKSCRVYVPAGEYTIAWASGPYWYGEEYLFGSLGTMNKSEATEIQSGRVSHTFTLEASEEGDVGYGDADLSDFR